MAYSCNPPEPPEPQARACGGVPALEAPASLHAPEPEPVAQPGAGELEAAAQPGAPGGQPACVAPEAPEALVCWVSTEQSHTAVCGAGRVGEPVTRSVPAGRFTSNISQAHADGRALALARAEAEALLACAWWNDEQAYTAVCGPGTSGNSVTVTVPAQSVQRPTRAEANAVALAQAREQAEAALVCLFLNETQTYTATCPEGSLGQPVTVVKGPDEAFMAGSVAEANALALAAAQAEAEAGLACVPDFFGGIETFIIPGRTGTLTLDLASMARFITPAQGPVQTLDLDGVGAFISPSYGAGAGLEIGGVSTFFSPTVGGGEGMELNEVEAFLIES